MKEVETKCRIGIYDWTIKFVSDNDKGLEVDDTFGLQYAFGTTDPSELCIYISRELNKQVIKSVLLHELTHAMLFSYSIQTDELTEESICYFMQAYGAELLAIHDRLVRKLKL